jgi:hypothetical protein
MVLDALDHLPDRLSRRAPRECVVADDHEQVPRAGRREVQPRLQARAKGSRSVSRPARMGVCGQRGDGRGARHEGDAVDFAMRKGHTATPTSDAAPLQRTLSASVSPVIAKAKKPRYVVLRTVRGWGGILGRLALAGRHLRALPRPARCRGARRTPQSGRRVTGSRRPDPRTAANWVGGIDYFGFECAIGANPSPLASGAVASRPS